MTVPTPRLPGGTITLMFTDLVGSTVRWESDPDGMRQALADHDDAAVDSIDTHGGRLIKRTGDGTFSVFTDARSAVLAALEIQAHARRSDDGSAVKAAIHTASMEPTGDDYIGPPVNKVSRMLDEAVGGQIVLSNASAALIEPAAIGARVESIGERPLRGLEATEHLWLIRTSHSTPGPPPRAGQRAELSLRRQLVGRSDDARALTQLIQHHRLVTIVGPGGVGKTSLALDHLRAVTSDTSVGFIDLTSVSSANFVRTVASQLGAATFEDIERRLAVGSWMLIFDNCEHVLDQSAAAVASLLSRVPHLDVIATSREPLGVPGEVIVRLDPLDTSGPDSPGVELFAQFALERGITIDTDDEAVIELASALDGLPLGLELAAARTVAFTPHEILSRLRDGGLDVLDRRRGHVHDRHAGVTATIEWSIDLLDEVAQRALESLSIFTGPFSTEMAIAAIGEPIGSGMELVADLVERSLVHREDSSARSSFRLLELIRLVANARLTDRGAEHTVWERVAQSVTRDLIEAGAAPIWSTMEAPYLLDEGFSVVERVISSAVADGTSVDTLLAMVRSFWALEDYGHRARGAQLVRDVIGRTEQRSEPLSNAYGNLSMLARMMGEEPAAVAAATRAIEIGHGSGAALGHRTLGLVARSETRWSDAMAHFDQASRLATQNGESALAAEATVHLAMTLARSGHLDEAIELIAPLVGSGQPGPISETIGPLFLAWFLILRDRPRARQLSSGVLERTIGSRDLWSIATASYQLAILAMLDGDPAGAASHLHTTIDLFTGTLARGDMVLALYAASALFSRTGRRREAAVAYHLVGALNPQLGAFEISILEQIGFDWSLQDEVPDRTGPRSLLLPLRQIASNTTTAPTTERSPATNRLVRNGRLWDISFGHVDATVPDSKGLRDIAVLLDRAGIEVPALELADAQVTSAVGLEASDRMARADYRARIRDLQEVIDDAEETGDRERAAAARTELDALVEHLSSAFGLTGTPRTTGRPDERARSAVTARIRATIKRLHTDFPEFGEHLDRSIKTGRFCVYDPPEQTSWDVSMP